MRVLLPVALALFAGFDRVGASEEPYGGIVKEIRISELRWTKEHTITRELASKVGEAYLAENAQKDLERLDRLGLFSSFEIHAIVEGDEVVLEVQVEEIYRVMIFPSIGISDENGLSIGPAIRTMNAWGRGIELGASARFFGETSVGFFAEDRWLFGNHFGLRFELGWRDRENVLDDFQEETFRVALTAKSYVRENGRIGGRIELESLKSDEPGKTLSPDNRDRLPTLAFFLGYDSRDYWSSPTKGWWNEFEIAQTGGVLGGEADYLTFTIDLRRFQPVKENHTVFLSSLTTLRTGESGLDIPSYHDYAFGGTNSVRGWELNARRGKNQFLNTLEYRYNIIPMTPWRVFGISLRSGLQLALFGDFGVLWDEGNQFALDNFIGGYGVGVRALMPWVGMFRLDFGFGQSGARIEVHFGVFEKAEMQRQRAR